MRTTLKDYERRQVLNAASLLDKEAESWADGWAVRKDGQLCWDKEGEWAHVRWFKLNTAAKNLRALAKP